MVIHKDELQHCWPSCVVLMSLISFSHVAIDGDFSIMATSNIVELPVKEKVDLLVRKKEQKSLIIDLNYALEKEEDIIIYTSYSLGEAYVYVSVYAQKYERIPSPEEYDFQLEDIETIIKVSEILQIIEREKIGKEANKYLYLVFYGYEDSKLSIQYDLLDRSKDIVKMLDYDTF